MPVDVPTSIDIAHDPSERESNAIYRSPCVFTPTQINLFHIHLVSVL
ncbi:uncharacterized protein G2W53_014738 [Senna tora]|uniref:Uncharacterized protein n=1 Tax=Senna tora TaxID=362788 RepID=A0A834WU39_9FABA|nr:uncharacterized protein G2W53_014738 [Senna tora]